MFLVAVLSVAPPAARADGIDDHIRAEMARLGVPGLSVAVLRDGQIVKLQGYGFADVAQRVPVTPETVFKIGSVSKPLIATGIMVLVEEGRLSLADPIAKHLEGTPDTWRGITIRHLLSHTSGLVREGPAFNPYKVQSDADVVASAHRLPLRFPTGSRWEYCNVGYFGLADIIRRVSGQPWRDYLRAKVFTPAGMTSTRPTDEKDPRQAVGYAGRENREIAPDWPAVRPSGAFLSTVVDLARWEQSLTSGRLLSDESRRLMWTPVVLSDGSSHPYGLGWELGKRGGRTFIGHGGSLPGFRSSFARFPDDRLTVIVLTNAERVDRDAIVHGIVEAALRAEAATAQSAR